VLAIKNAFAGIYTLSEYFPSSYKLDVHCYSYDEIGDLNTELQVHLSPSIFIAKHLRQIAKL